MAFVLLPAFHSVSRIAMTKAFLLSVGEGQGLEAEEKKTKKLPITYTKRMEKLPITYTIILEINLRLKKVNG